jgi:hypothetical protein
VGWVSLVWTSFIVVVLCLPEEYPVTPSNMNTSVIALGAVVLFATLWCVMMHLTMATITIMMIRMMMNMIMSAVPAHRVHGQAIQHEHQRHRTRRRGPLCHTLVRNGDDDDADHDENGDEDEDEYEYECRACPLSARPRPPT